MGDPYWAPQPARPLIEEVGAGPGKLRINHTVESPMGSPVHEDCVKAVEDAVRLCSDLGHELVEDTPAIDGEMLTPAFMALWAAGIAWSIDGMVVTTGKEPKTELVEPLSRALREMGGHQRPDLLAGRKPAAEGLP